MISIRQQICLGLAGLAGLAWLLLGEVVRAAEAGPALSQKELRRAIERSLPLVERSAAVTLKAKDCFTCHHGAHAAMALNEAWSRGLRLQRNSLEDQLARAYGELVEEQPRFEKGFSVSNTTDSPGHALWLLQVAGWDRDVITDGTVKFFLSQQESRGNWETAPARPPTVGSPFTVTFVSLRALKHYGQAEQMRQGFEKAEKWLLNTPAEDTEDRVYRYRALDLLEKRAEAAEELAAILAEQRKDGGWGQLPHLQSDAYATGTVLAALADTGEVSAESTVYQRGLRYLLRTQKPDGSWHVKKRTRSIQPMFDSGFPHGQDQFISYSATCWSTYAILKALPADKKRARTDFVSSSRNLQKRLEKMVPGS